MGYSQVIAETPTIPLEREQGKNNQGIDGSPINMAREGDIFAGSLAAVRKEGLAVLPSQQGCRRDPR